MTSDLPSERLSESQRGSPARKPGSPVTLGWRVPSARVDRVCRAGRFLEMGCATVLTRRGSRRPVAIGRFGHHKVVLARQAPSGTYADPGQHSARTFGHTQRKEGG